MLLPLLRHHFGISSLRPLQERIMNSLLEGHDTLVILPTGAGKSLCYQLPALVFPGMTIVISPLLALIRDQAESLQGKGISALRWDSTLSPQEEAHVLSELRSGKCKILYLSPEKALKQESQRIIFHSPVSHICVDEAHCIAQWGWDFRPQYRELAQFISACQTQQERPVVSAFTATATLATARDIVSTLELQQTRVFAVAFQRPNLSYQVRYVKSEADKRTHMLRSLEAWKKSQNGSALIYASTRYETESLVLWLQSLGWKQALSYHAGLPSKTREKRQHIFQKNKQALMIATSAFGMGVDKANVRLVLHHSPPPSLEAYVQEAGRGGRDGLPAQAILFYQPKDLARNWRIQSSQASQERQGVIREHALRMQSYCESTRCLAEKIEKTFYQPSQKKLRLDPCTCSVCAPTAPLPETKHLPSSTALAKLLQLKLTRKSLAKKNNVPPYFLGNDKLLHTIAITAPQTWQELKTIAGMGHARLFYWGKEILSITKA